MLGYALYRPFFRKVRRGEKLPPIWDTPLVPIISVRGVKPIGPPRSAPLAQKGTGWQQGALNAKFRARLADFELISAADTIALNSCYPSRLPDMCQAEPAMWDLPSWA